ncbi:hypothetical protein [Cellulomonas sp. ATA003]|uniref:hypothetical protein n=1 Tax=Cellulomonas sp. ATA003 TaxID=3073064 RepID=UPI002872BB84|nr:hypothetical protein [Cellulomonas sp. ATA003]WNB87302.1 hypothetical protein REH70_09485 [Cellulomonas sp. ATA003]
MATLRPWLVPNADVRCDHPGGKVRMTSSQHLVHVQGRRVVVGQDPVGRPIAGCPNLSPSTKPCTTTLRVKEGRSPFVFIEGRPVIRADLVGLTDGTPAMGVSYRVANPGQTLVAEGP